MHGIIDSSILTTERGIWAIKWSYAGLFLTAFIRAIIVYYSGSIPLFADTIPNFGAALTAIPFLFAFMPVWCPVGIADYDNDGFPMHSY
jgi:divalent metal cation (Fe/Co/Zn/Cd) transporter